MGTLPTFKPATSNTTSTAPSTATPPADSGDNPRHGWTQPAGTPKEPVVICEGFPDAYTANSAGYTAVAVLGATNANRGLAERIAKGIGNGERSSPSTVTTPVDPLPSSSPHRSNNVASW